MNRFVALDLLGECTGDDLWSIDYCQRRKVPQAWIEELVDAYESNHGHLADTIFVGSKPVNHYEGLRDVDLAIKLGEYLGVDTERLRETALTRRALVLAIQEAVEEE